MEYPSFKDLAKATVPSVYVVFVNSSALLVYITEPFSDSLWLGTTSALERQSIARD
jgi:hypothetical protein